jgi:hypothetical protein
MGFSAAVMTRETGWFDVPTLSLYVHTEGANLIRDCGLDVGIIFRLRCVEAELSQLSIDFDQLLDAARLVREYFLGLPWYPENMVQLLQLRKQHLFALRLAPKDYKFLLSQRGWNIKFLRESLGFTDAELLQVVGLSGSAILACARVPCMPMYSTTATPLPSSTRPSSRPNAPRHVGAAAGAAAALSNSEPVDLFALDTSDYVYSFRQAGSEQQLQQQQSGEESAGQAPEEESSLVQMLHARDDSNLYQYKFT